MWLSNNFCYVNKYGKNVYQIRMKQISLVLAQNLEKAISSNFTWGCIFSVVRPFYERTVSNLDP